MHGAVAMYVVFDLLIGYTVVRAVYRIVAHIYASHKWRKQFQAAKHKKLTKRLNYKYRSLQTEIIVVKDEAFVALAMGMSRPRIVVSTAVLGMFNDMK